AAAGIEAQHGASAEQARGLGDRLRTPRESDVASSIAEPNTGLETVSCALNSAPTAAVGQIEHSGNDAHPSDEPFRKFTRLIDAEVHEEHARNLLFEAQQAGVFSEQTSETRAIDSIRTLVESHLRCSGGISLAPGQRRVVAVVGPTGVGKTTTIAKLAA